MEDSHSLRPTVHYRLEEPLNIIEKYQQLVAEDRWEEAVVVIEEIIERAPDIVTSWFNYGVCLDALERHADAAEAFKKAQQLDPEDWGVYYRIFRSLLLADDLTGFLEFAYFACELNPEMLESLCKSSEFGHLFERADFQELRDKYS